MPYIIQTRREDIEEYGRKPTTAGELNFAITRLLRAYTNMKGTGYQTYNDIMGALEGAKMEIYRRKIAPYEDAKMSENGDVY